MEKVLMFAGIGGQGLQLAGKLLTKSAIAEGREATFFPIYGGQKRGGVSSCYVIISDHVIGAPVRQQIDVGLLMDPIGYQNYHKQIAPDGIMIVNASVVDVDPLACNGIVRPELFLELVQKGVGNGKAIGILALGYVIGMTELVHTETMLALIRKEFVKPELQELNVKAFLYGYSHAKAQSN